jgi:hypothetical protein
MFNLVYIGTVNHHIAIETPLSTSLKILYKDPILNQDS